MYYAFAKIVEKSWIAWCGIFDFLPYGDTLVAGFALLFVAAISCKLVADGRL